MNKKLIEAYRHSSEGYNPYLIGPKWQVAQLNFQADLAPDAIKKIDVHYLNEEEQKELKELIESVWENS